MPAYDDMKQEVAVDDMELGGNAGRAAAGGLKAPLNPSGAADPSAEKVNNGARSIKGLSILMTLLVATITALLWGMVGLKGADDTDIGDRASYSLSIMASLQTIALGLACWDTLQILLQFPAANQLVKFETQHESFKRMSMPFALSLVLFFPALATFTLHSLGTEFWDLLSDSSDAMPSDMRSCIITLIVAFLGMVFLGVFHLDFAEWMMRTVFWVNEDLLDFPPQKHFRVNLSRWTLAVLTLGGTCFYYGVLIWAVSLVSYNSGIVSAFILFTLVLLPFLFVCSLSLAARPLHLLDRVRIQRTRNVACLMVTVVYLSYWVNLLILLLEGVFEQGWWETVAGTVPADKGLCGQGAPACQLNRTRSAVAFSYMTLILVYLGAYGWRIWLHKLNTKWTLPREEFPEAVLRRRDEFHQEQLGKEAQVVVTHKKDLPVTMEEVEAKAGGGGGVRVRRGSLPVVLVDGMLDVEQGGGPAAAVVAVDNNNDDAKEEEEDDVDDVEEDGGDPEAPKKSKKKKKAKKQK